MKKVQNEFHAKISSKKNFTLVNRIETPLMVDFFVNSGIPSDRAKKYVKLFSTHHLDSQQFYQLTDVSIVDIGVQSLGDRQAMLGRIKVKLQFLYK